MKKIKLPQTQRVHISLMTTLTEKAGLVSFSGQCCKWKAASVARAEAGNLGMGSKVALLSRKFCANAESFRMFNRKTC